MKRHLWQTTLVSSEKNISFSRGQETLAKILQANKPRRRSLE